MSIQGNYTTYNQYQYGFGNLGIIQRQRAVSFQNQRPVSSSRATFSASAERVQSLRAMRQMVRMRKAIEAMGTLMSADRGIEARASSSANLGLDTNGSPTTMVSTEEVNATPTSISTFAPEVIGSTAHAAIGGEYDGSNGTDTLTFKVDRDGTHGEDNLQLKVFDSNDDQIDQIDIDNQDPLGQQYTLSNGLVLSLGEGTLVKDDTFTVDVVAVPGSFSPSQPEWAAGSTDSITLGGVYDGSNGTDTLTFKVNHGGTHGVDNLQLKVFDANDNQIDQIDIHDNDPLDQQYTLSNGVVLALGEGELLADTFFTVEVFDGVGSAVDPSKPFDALRADNPNLESGTEITNGSFQINGVDITVSDDDTINSVLDRITQSSAGVTATFDAAAETIVLTQKTPGPTQDIILGNDSSGFLAAMKLDDASSIPGEEPETEKPLAEVARFASVQSGDVYVNDVSISIDVNTDSLNDILERITASTAEVTASFGTSNQRVSLASENSNDPLILDSGETNFFSTLNISDGTYSPTTDPVQAPDLLYDPSQELANVVAENLVSTTGSDSLQPVDTPTQGVAPGDARMLSTLVKITADAMNRLFDDTANPSSSPIPENTRNEIRTAVSQSFASEGPSFKTDFGIHIDFENSDKGVFNFSQEDQRQLETALTNKEGQAAVQKLLFGSESDGLLERLHAVLSTAGSSMEGIFGSNGLFLDATV
jgi:hypothetical protein